MSECGGIVRKIIYVVIALLFLVMFKGFAAHNDVVTDFDDVDEIFNATDVSETLERIEEVEEKIDYAIRKAETEIVLTEKDETEEVVEETVEVAVEENVTPPPVDLIVDKSKYMFEGTKASYNAKIEDMQFKVFYDNQWEEKFLRGINVGAAKPGAFPGEMAITKAEYLRWFKYMSEMNADVIRVYTTQNPSFYEALYEFNYYAEKPLYLMHGVWIDEGNIYKYLNAYDEESPVKADFIKDAKDIVDILHGNGQLTASRRGFASGDYEYDVSPYVIGWIFGIEWDPFFVDETNKKNKNMSDYSGTFMYTEDAEPFEIFLCEVGDEIVTYEFEKYSTQRPISFTNWLTTDPLEHEIDPNEDMVSVDTENIKTNEAYEPGMFASYHVYPYYPDFMNYQEDYIAFKDENGNTNTYQAYLKELMAYHTVPILVAEFGVPASRGKAHESRFSNADQGNLSEEEQGYILSTLINNIHEENYMGGLVFSWQDEWFKRTWNTVDLDLASRRPYWSNAQTNEQSFGLLTFDPGAKESVCYVDGKISEWQNEKPITRQNGIDLYAKADEKYLYFMMQLNDFDPENQSIVLPIDTKPNQGNVFCNGLNVNFSRASDFYIFIENDKNARILVDGYYDSFNYLYGEKMKLIPKEEVAMNSGDFNKIYLCLSRHYNLGLGEEIPFTKYETGQLIHGNGNPNSINYNSLVDYNFTGNIIEMRIPWLMINVMDPSTKTIMSDFNVDKAIESMRIDDIFIGAGVTTLGEISTTPINMGKFTWEEWHMPQYHERLKQSYYILQNTFAELKSK